MADHERNGASRSVEPDAAPAANRVGYGEPPPESRFTPGRSGNLRGRPRGAKGHKQIVSKIANELHWVGEGGKRHRRSTLELVLLQLRNLAAQGNVQAFRAYDSLLAKYSAQGTEMRGGYMIVPEVRTIEEWEREFGSNVSEFQRRLAEDSEAL